MRSDACWDEIQNDVQVVLLWIRSHRQVEADPERCRNDRFLKQSQPILFIPVDLKVGRSVILRTFQKLISVLFRQDKHGRSWEVETEKRSSRIGNGQHHQHGRSEYPLGCSHSMTWGCNPSLATFFPFLGRSRRNVFSVYATNDYKLFPEDGPEVPSKEQLSKLKNIVDSEDDSE